MLKLDFKDKSSEFKKCLLHSRSICVCVSAVLAIIYSLVISFPAAEVLWRRVTLTTYGKFGWALNYTWQVFRIYSSRPYTFSLALLPEGTVCSRSSRFREPGISGTVFLLMTLLSFPQRDLSWISKEKGICSLFPCSQKASGLNTCL